MAKAKYIYEERLRRRLKKRMAKKQRNKFIKKNRRFGYSNKMRGSQTTVYVLRKERFDALAGFSRLPHAQFITRELEWYADSDENIIATILIDYDGEFSVIVLGRDSNFRFRCIECMTSYCTIEEARTEMYEIFKKFRANGQRIFPQGDEKKRKYDIFNPIYETRKLNSNFEVVRNQKGYSSAKEIISELMHHYIDVDGNFVEQFQTSGFDARLWELYLFAYLTEEGLFLDRTHNAPDFIVSNGDHAAAIEAVIVQSSQKSDVESFDFESLTEERILELQRDYMPIRFGSPLYSKLKKKYWELDHVSDVPLVFAVADFHEKQSMMWSSTALINYLYGVRHDYDFDNDDRLVISAAKIGFHEYGNKKIPSGFFFTENAEHISAIMFSATGTISKFIRMGKVAGFGSADVKVIYRGFCHKHDPNAALPDPFFFEINEKYSEKWSEGLSIFHNPRALKPLSEDLFPSAAHHRMQEDGQIVSHLPEFHPYNAQTIMMQPVEK